MAAVHHAEVVAHRVGEPFGSLILAVAVTVIEVALIVTLMLSGGPETASLARGHGVCGGDDHLNGIVGLSILVGAIRQTQAQFNAEGTSTALATVATLATLSLVFPRFTTSRPGPEFSPEQLVFAAISSIVLYALFVIVQTIRHRDYCLPVEVDNTDPESHADPPSNRETFLSLSLLVVALVAVVGLAKTGSPAIETAVRAIGVPRSRQLV